MALSRRSGRTEGNIWAGFVDAMGALLLVMIFVLTIFMILQFLLRQTVIGQGQQLTSLEAQIASISEALGATKRQNEELQTQNQGLETNLAQLQFNFDQQNAKIADFETQVASLIASQQKLQADADAAEAAKNAALSDQQKAELALAAARNEISQQDADARLAAAKADALQAMLDDLSAPDATDNTQIEASIARVMALASAALSDEAIANSETGTQLRDEVAKLTELEQQRLAEQASIDYLRERLKNSDNELIAMTLALEEERKKAEDNLTILAALQTQREEIVNSNMTEEEKNKALLALANQEIAARDKASTEDARRIALLNQQTAQLRTQLNALQGLLDAASAADTAANVQIESMGASLNSALARVAAVERARANDLETYRSEFFGKIRKVLEGVDGIEVVGDRFVFSSEVLFAPGSDKLSPEGRAQISKIGQLINGLTSQIPNDIPWIIRVDGHTDVTPLSPGSPFADNWALSQARALSVVRYMIAADGVSPDRLAPTGFGEYHPIDNTNTPEGLAHNRRIEFKLTEE